jgi:hypothetical protein
MPIDYVAQLDEALLNQSPAGTYTGAAYTSGKPRFFFINMKYLHPVFHGKHFFEETDPINGGARQRDAFTMYVVSWYNWVCTSRRRQGIIVPTNP